MRENVISWLIYAEPRCVRGGNHTVREPSNVSRVNREHGLKGIKGFRSTLIVIPFYK